MNSLRFIVTQSGMYVNLAHVATLSVASLPLTTNYKESSGTCRMEVQATLAFAGTESCSNTACLGLYDNLTDANKALSGIMVHIIENKLPYIPVPARMVRVTGEQP